MAEMVLHYSPLERIPVGWNISCVGEVVHAFLGRKAIEQVAEGVP
jgi:hypothetical protein